MAKRTGETKPCKQAWSQLQNSSARANEAQATLRKAGGALSPRPPEVLGANQQVEGKVAFRSQSHGRLREPPARLHLDSWAEGLGGGSPAPPPHSPAKVPSGLAARVVWRPQPGLLLLLDACLWPAGPCPGGISSGPGERSAGSGGSGKRDRQVREPPPALLSHRRPPRGAPLLEEHSPGLPFPTTSARAPPRPYFNG